MNASSEDFGPHGCQLVSPQPFPKGTLLQIDLASQELREVLRVAGTVAWCSPQSPWRLGLAFTAPTRAAATKFFDKLVAARPGLANWRRVPDKLSLDAMVWLAPPPTRVVDFTADELTMIRAVGSGATIYELRARLKDHWSIGQRAFFSLLSSGAITLSRGASAPYQNWLDLLDRLEADLAPAAMIPPAPPPPRPAPQAARVPPAPPAPRTPPAPQDLRPHPASARPAPTPAWPSPAPAPLAGRPATPPAPPEQEPLLRPRNDGSAGLDRELDLEALDPEGGDAAPLELLEPEPVELVEELPPLEGSGGDALAEERDWPSEPAAPPDPYAPWPEPPPGKPRGRG